MAEERHAGFTPIARLTGDMSWDRNPLLESYKDDVD